MIWRWRIVSSARPHGAIAAALCVEYGLYKGHRQTDRGGDSVVRGKDVGKWTHGFEVEEEQSGR